MLPQDIITKVQQDFSKDDAVLIVQLLSELQAENPRVFCDRKGVSLHFLHRCDGDLLFWRDSSLTRLPGATSPSGAVVCPSHCVSSIPARSTM